jgi:S-adenosylmethionine hydrolase
LITLLTDFGTADYFVPAVKGAILSVHPQATLIDITHEIPAHDIRSAAFTLNACFRDFPERTVHLAVVDPGVGSSRRPLVITSGGQILVGPDNGVFSFVFRQAAEFHVFHATEAQFMKPSGSETFHGRDLFAPLSALLDQGLDPAEVGPEVLDYNVFDIPDPQYDSATGMIIGEIIHIDRFGNCITNLTTKELDGFKIPAGTCLLIGTQRVTHFGGHFAQAAGGELLAYPGSAGYWEIGLWCRSAAALLDLRRGARVVLETGPAGRVDR